MVQIASEVYVQNGCAAHRRRQNDTQISLGCRLRDVRDEIVRRIPGIPRSLSTNTIARMNVPPHRGRSNSTRYRSLINAKVPPKRNDVTKDPHEGYI